MSSWDYLGSIGLQPIGQAASGPVVATFGLTTTLYGAAALFSVLLPVPAVRNFTTGAADLPSV